MRLGAAMLIGRPRYFPPAPSSQAATRQPMVPVPTIPTTDTPRRLIPGMSRATIARVTTVPA